MKIFNIFKRKSTDKIANLEKEIESLKLKSNIVQKGVTNDSLMAFNNGRVEWYNLANNTYDKHYTIFRGIDLLASLGSSLPPQIYRGKELMANDFKLPPSFFDINMPNPNMSLNEILYNALVFFFYRGEFMIEIKEAPFFHLLPINPVYMTRTNDKINWKYQHGTERRIISSENLIYVKQLNPDDDERGLGPVDVVKADLLNEEAAVEYNTSFFKNFGRIGGFFYDKDGKARPDSMRTLVDEFNNLYRGKHNAHKIIGLQEGIRFENLNQTMREMEYLESRKDIRDRILAILGIHKALFGVTDQVNRSVSEEATRMLWIQNLKPKMDRVQQKINQVLFRKYFPQYKFVFDYSNIAELKQGVESVLEQVKVYRDLGYNTNEINEKFNLNMPEIEGPRGDMRFVPSNLIPIEDFLYEESNNKDKEKKSIDKEDILKSYFEEDKSIKNNRYLRRYNKLNRSSMRKFRGKLRKFFSKELGQIINIVLNRKNYKSRVTEVNALLSDIYNQLEENKLTLQSTVKPVYEGISFDADRLAIDTIGSTAEPVASEAVVGSLTNKITGISNHRYRKIRTQVKDGVNAGETIDSIAERIRSVYRFEASRSVIIARTEVGNVVHRTTDERYKKEGVKKKEWINAGDSEVRDSHIENSDVGIVDYDYMYSSGQKFPNDGRGGASENVNCRCTFIPILEN